jgi:hypothetical protein
MSAWSGTPPQPRTRLVHLVSPKPPWREMRDRRARGERTGFCTDHADFGNLDKAFRQHFEPFQPTNLDWHSGSAFRMRPINEL